MMKWKKYRSEWQPTYLHTHTPDWTPLINSAAAHDWQVPTTTTGNRNDHAYCTYKK